MVSGEVVEEKIRVFVRARPVCSEDEEEVVGVGGEGCGSSTFLGGEVGVEEVASCIEDWTPEGACVYRRPGASADGCRRFQFSGFLGPEARPARRASTP